MAAWEGQVTTERLGWLATGLPVGGALCVLRHGSKPHFQMLLPAYVLQAYVTPPPLLPACRFVQPAYMAPCASGWFSQQLMVLAPHLHSLAFTDEACRTLLQDELDDWCVCGMRANPSMCMP